MKFYSLFNGSWMRVDPYGWESAAGHPDPSAVSGVSTVDGVNVNRWAP